MAEPRNDELLDDIANVEAEELAAEMLNGRCCD